MTTPETPDVPAADQYLSRSGRVIVASAAGTGRWARLCGNRDDHGVAAAGVIVVSAAGASPRPR